MLFISIPNLTQPRTWQAHTNLPTCGSEAAALLEEAEADAATATAAAAAAEFEAPLLRLAVGEAIEGEMEVA